MEFSEIISLIISLLAMSFSGFSIWYTRKILLLNKSEQERNDHIELSVEIFDVEKNIFSFKNISHRRIIYLENAEYKNVLQTLYSKVLWTWLEEKIALNFHDEKIIFEPNTKIVIYFRDDLGRRFSKECEIYSENEINNL